MHRDKSRLNNPIFPVRYHDPEPREALAPFPQPDMTDHGIAAWTMIMADRR